MVSLTVLAFVSPVFGLRLDLDPALLQSALALPDAVLADMAEPEAIPDAPASDPEPALAGPEAPAIDPAAAAVAPESVAEASAAEPDADAEETVDVATQMARRARIARVHKWLGISTWGSMTLTVLFGTLQYVNRYGFFAPQSETRCVRGNAILGNESCIGTPFWHTASAAITGALYYTTFAVSFAMPDPIGLDQGDSDSARRLRQHKRLRWIHFSGMAAQFVLGIIAANPEWIGADRANHYRAARALATTHLAIGFATYGTLTYAGARMAF